MTGFREAEWHDWLLAFARLRTETAHAEALRDADDTDGGRLFLSDTGGTAFAVLRDGELAHLVSTESLGGAAVDEGMRQGGCWAVCPSGGPSHALLESRGFQVMASTDGDPDDPRPWARADSDLMVAGSVSFERMDCRGDPDLFEGAKALARLVGLRALLRRRQAGVDPVAAEPRGRG